MKLYRLTLVFLIILLADCSSLRLEGGSPPPKETNLAGTPLPPVKASPVPGGSPTPQKAATPSEMVLHIWVPPQFDPADNTQAGSLLKARLNEFTATHPGVKLEVRVKAQEGPGGLLDALSTASAAAPLALPDLVALPRPILEAAALKGLLHSYDGLIAAHDDPDWPDYARQLAHLQNSTFGLPFAGDALLLVYHPKSVGVPPRDLDSLLKVAGLVAFPAADPEALFTLALYQAAGGPIQDSHGRPDIDANILTQVLTFFQEGEMAGLMPFWLTQFDTYDQADEAYRQGQASLAITWASHYLGRASNLPTDEAASLIPTADGKPFTLATGWVWALASPQPDRFALTAQLAEFLTDSKFLAEWTLAVGYLPTRSSSLSYWPESPLQSLASQIIPSARLYPSADILSGLGPTLEQATVQVLKRQSDPLAAAQSAADHLHNP